MMTTAMAEAVVVGGQRSRGLALTVLYDDGCPLCRRLKDWLATQRSLLPLEFVPAASEEARARFPSLDHRRSMRVLTVVASDGAVYEKERAWLVCAWALPGWRPVAEGLGAGRVGRRVASVATGAVDGYRHRRLGVRREECASCR